VVTVEGEEHPLSSGTMVFVPRGARRSVRSASEDFAYLSVHRRRGPLRIGG
jgi:quercetin dioxygenase-like cupin family protein